VTSTPIPAAGYFGGVERADAFCRAKAMLNPGFNDKMGLKMISFRALMASTELPIIARFTRQQLGTCVDMIDGTVCCSRNVTQLVYLSALLAYLYSLYRKHCRKCLFRRQAPVAC
jgi:hypothetical protein